MFISIEKASELSGKSKNALYRLMAKGHIHFVHCTKGKRYLELAELKRVYPDIRFDVTEQSIIEDSDAANLAHPLSGAGENNRQLLDVVGALRIELAALASKVDKQTQLLESLSNEGMKVQQPEPVAAPAQQVDRPENDPQWPPFITCYADLAKRDEIKARYGK